MADDSPLTQDPAVLRYDLIEQAYRDNRWSDVIADGAGLLGDLESRRDPTAMALRPRLQLLLGHTNLYGIGDAQAAERLYGAVLSSDAEVELLETAQQGLRQCRSTPAAEDGSSAAEVDSGAVGVDSVAVDDQPLELLPSTPSDAASGPDVSPTEEVAAPWLGELKASPAGTGAEQPLQDPLAPAQPVAEATPSGDPGDNAMPWTQDISAPQAASPATTLVPEVVEEPEVIEVHQQDPALAEEIELTVESGGRAGTEPGRSTADRDEDLRGSLLKVVIR